MKSKFLFLAILLSGVFAQNSIQAQFTKLENVTITGYPMGTARYMKDARFFTTSVENNEHRGGITIYNDDFETIKKFKASELISGGTRFIPQCNDKEDFNLMITQHFFNSDDLIEFVISGLDFIAIVNENGEVLFKEAVVYERSDISIFDTGSKRYFSYSDGNGNYDIYKIDNTVSTGKALFTRMESFPNPATDFINIAYKAQNGQSETLTVANANGQVMECIVLDPAQELYRLDVSRYTSGMYVYKYGDASGKFVVK